MKVSEESILLEFKDSLISVLSYESFEDYLSSFDTSHLNKLSYKFFKSVCKDVFNASRLNVVCSSRRPTDIPTLLDTGQVSFIGRSKFMYLYKLENFKLEEAK